MKLGVSCDTEGTREGFHLPMSMGLLFTDMAWGSVSENDSQKTKINKAKQINEQQ
jgi:hypothetical protein